MAEEGPTVQSSRAEVWFLKQITFGSNEHKRTLRIITQNFNGPCSFIAICNILILRGNIEILPPSRNTVSYEFLSQLVAEYLLTSSPDVDISAALSIMPVTQKGMDLNPVFTGPTSFRPAGTGGELKLFEQVGIKLVHGWLVDPDSPEAAAVAKTADYDSTATFIADADHTAKGQLVVADESNVAGSSRHSNNWTDEERIKIETAISMRRFLENTWSQLTYHGLFTLASTLEPGALVALFRSSHLSVLYKSTGDDSSLYTLVTDQVFLHEPSIVWERLEDIDGGWSTFVDSDFVRASPAGGDFAGQTAEEALRAAENAAGRDLGVVDPVDQALARQMQAEEEHYARRQEEVYLREQQRKHEERTRPTQKPEKPKKKKSDCIIM